MKIRLPKLSSVLYRVKRALGDGRNFLYCVLKDHAVRIDFYRLSHCKFDVWIGANYGKTTGVGFHMQAIKHYSSLRMQLIPSSFLMNLISPHDFEFKYNYLFSRVPSHRLLAVHSHVYPWFIKWCRSRQLEGVRWIHTYHALYFPECNNGMLLPWQIEFNDVMVNVGRYADVCVSVTKYQQKHLRDVYGIKTVYIPNGVNVVLCDKASSERFNKKFGCRNFLLHVGRHDPVKNLGDFVRLTEIMPEHQFVIIGPGLTRQVLISEYHMGAQSNVLILGELSHAQVQDAICSCSVLVSTSIREGLPTLVLEAMAHQKPIVVSNEPGSMEAIDNGRFGYYYSLGDLDDLKKNVLLALADQEKPKLARQRVLEEYDWRVVARKLDAIYRGETLC